MNNASSTIDLQIGLTRVESEVQISLVLDLQSDHAATLIEIHAVKYTSVPPTMRLNLNTANWILFKNQLYSTDYFAISLEDDIEIKAEN